MIEKTIGKNDSGQRFDKYLKRLLCQADNGFIYKMLRKKNIVLNGKKSEGKEILSEGDQVKFFLSDETFRKFSQSEENLSAEYEALSALDCKELTIIFENEDILVLDKPKNMLSQKASPSDISANELLISYLIQSGKLSREEFRTFHPSVCNRLDQNTTGLLLFGKSKKGLQDLSLALKERSAKKYYYAIVSGRLKEEGLLKGFLSHDSSNNKVTVSQKQEEGFSQIETYYKPLNYNPKSDISLLEIELITGKTHQIRAHLASIGHPIIGDYKYGFRPVNDRFKSEYGIDSQLLHSGKTILPEFGSFEAPMPPIFNRLMQF